MHKKIALLELIGGVSGDMLIGALLGAGLSKKDLLNELNLIDLPKWNLEAQLVNRCAVKATHINFVDEQNTQKKYGWDDFINIINESKLPDEDKQKIKNIFNILMTAETNVHQVDSHDLHLHELGTIDTILDISGFVIGLRLLGISDLYCSSLPISIGVINNSHGVMTSNSLAVIEIYKAYNLPVRYISSDFNKEMVTPTGAAIVSSLCKFNKVEFNISSISYGAGTSNPENYPNVLGLWTGEKFYKNQEDIFLLETNIDDTTGEVLGYTMEKLFQSNAIDVWFTPIQMKKNRPATQLSVMVNSSDLDKISRIILIETSTLGVRIKRIDRIKADRETHEINTSLGKANVKIKKINGKVINFSPEYESCKIIANKNNISLNDVISLVIDESKNKLS